MRALCSLRLCGERFCWHLHHGDAENTEDAQRFEDYSDRLLAGIQMRLSSIKPDATEHLLHRMVPDLQVIVTRVLRSSRQTKREL